MTATASDFDLAALGAAVRTARRARGMTVEVLARAANVSAGLISQVERGQGNPSFLTLRKLAEALGLPVAHFVQGPPSSGMVVRAGQRKRLHLPEGDLVYELLTPGLQGKLEVLRTQVPPGWTNRAKPFLHDGEECVHLLSGRIDVVVGGDRYTLDEGDSITYEASRPHWYANRSTEPAIILGVVTPPSF
ncbi:helix-turn-helix domain-containing protein [Plantactinospora sp. GCM10030261]|uniref:helix-turn-helix domain-containing protein n=1 Tax=Plantactinospora sp. GCM10030261 TaxID=3273420 RepID=UPI00361A52D9